MPPIFLRQRKQEGKNRERAKQTKGLLCLNLYNLRRMPIIL